MPKPKQNQQSKYLRVPYALAVFGKEEIKAVNDVLQTPQIVAGARAAEFESNIARLFGKRYGVLVNSGSSANLLALEVLRLPPGSEVITPVLTFATTVAPIIKAGLVPAFADVGVGTYTIRVDQIEPLITRKTKAILVPSLFGNIPDLPRIAAIAKKHKLFLIEDSCDTVGATINGKPTGSYSDISTTSFYASHVITAAGEGGMIMANNPMWHQEIRILSGWGRRSALNETEDIAKRLQTRIGGMPYDAKFVFSEIGYNMRTTDIAAAFGLAQLKKLGRFSGLRRKHFGDLKKFLKRYEQFFVLPEAAAARTHTNWLAFPITIRRGSPFTRQDIVKFLERRNIQTRPVFTGNILRQPGFARIRRKTLPGGYPNADYIMKNSFVVGSHHGLTQKHVKHLKDTLREFLETHVR